MSNETIQTSSASKDAPAAPPAYFLSLTVENYRCFGPAQTLDLSRGDGRPAPWTIILGENGVGKTTLLQCLAAFQPETINLVDLADNTQHTNHLIFRFSLLRPPGLLPNWKNREGQFPAAMKYTFCYQGTLRSNDLFLTHTVMIRLSGNGGQMSPAPSDGYDNLICYGYGASRRMGKGTLSEQRSEDTTASLFSDDVNLINAGEWLLQADYAASRAQEIGKAAQRRDQIKDILTKTNLLPDVEDIRFREPENRFDTPSVEFQTPYGWVTLNSLSLGYRTLITWMVDLASRLFDRYPDSPNPLAEPAVVLVDEIDLHLHPRWQRTLMQFLSDKFPNAQFIATAHSPLVVQAATDANIVLLRREGDHVVIENNVETIKNWRVDQILTSDLFGLESARPPQIDDALEERTRILSQPRLSEADEKRLRELETQIGELPTGETPEDLQAMDIIRRAAELLKAGAGAAR